jgi:hypothetical protein
LHAFCAAWKTGDRGSTPSLESILSSALPSEKVGSGNFGTPCARMQAENFSACSCIFACSAALGGLMSSSFWHAFSAARKVAEPGSIPMPGPIVRPPSLFGSGKFRTPCERMQAENAAPSPAFVRPPPDPPPLEEESLLELVVPMFATAGVGEPPPQPAASGEAATRARAAMTVWRVCMVVTPSASEKTSSANRDNATPVTTRGRHLLRACNPG